MEVNVGEALLVWFLISSSSPLTFKKIKGKSCCLNWCNINVTSRILAPDEVFTVSLAGTETRLLLLLGSLLPRSLALHAAGLLGRELRPLSGGEVSGRVDRSSPPRRRCRSR